MKVLLACLLLAVAISSAAAYCSMGAVKSVKHRWSNNMMHYCEYKGIKMKSGSEFTDVDACQKCGCSTTGLTCCGIGYNAGVMNIHGCKVVNDLCAVAILNTAGTALCHQ